MSLNENIIKSGILDPETSKDSFISILVSNIQSKYELSLSASDLKSTNNMDSDQQLHNDNICFFSTEDSGRGDDVSSVQLIFNQSPNQHQSTQLSSLIGDDSFTLEYPNDQASHNDDELDLDIVDILMGGGSEDLVQSTVHHTNSFNSADGNHRDQFFDGSINNSITTIKNSSNFDNRRFFGDDSSELAAENENGRVNATVPYVETFANDFRKKTNSLPPKAWKLNESTPKILSLSLHPDSILRQWSHANFRQSSLEEVEEKLLRSIAYECDISIDRKPFRLGTSYLDSRYDVQPATINEVHHESNVVSSVTESAKLDVKYTADELLLKVENTKRQCGQEVTVDDDQKSFNYNHYLQTKSVVHKAQAVYWNENIDDHQYDSEYLMKSKRPKLNSAADQQSLAEYVRTNGYTANQSINAPSSTSLPTSTLALSGISPVVHNAILKHYVPPLQLWNSSISIDSNSLIGENLVSDEGIFLPDLAVTTLQIPWRSLAPEFAIVSMEENAGEFVDGLSNILLSHAELSVDSVLLNSSSLEKNNVNGQMKKENGKVAEADIVINHTLKRKLINDVHAPAFRDISQVINLTNLVRPY
jgi:hypothetical protein